MITVFQKRKEKGIKITYLVMILIKISRKLDQFKHLSSADENRRMKKLIEDNLYLYVSFLIKGVS